MRPDSMSASWFRIAKRTTEELEHPILRAAFLSRFLRSLSSLTGTGVVAISEDNV